MALYSISISVCAVHTCVGGLHTRAATRPNACRYHPLHGAQCTYLHRLASHERVESAVCDEARQRASKYEHLDWPSPPLDAYVSSP